MSLQVSDEARDNTHWRKVQGGQVQILWQDGEQAFFILCFIFEAVNKHLIVLFRKAKNKLDFT